MKRLKHLVWALLVLLLTAGAAGAAAPRAVYVLPAVGSINPGLAEFIVEGIQQAERQNAAALVIELDTPGGLETSMRQIVQAISNAKVPVIVYVYPRSARAASAGVFITMAANVAAMAPGTNIGAAHPVSVGMGKIDKTMEKKVLNDMVASGRSLAGERGRNADWMEKAVRQSVSIPAAEAVKLKVVDLMADNLEDLLAKINGRKVEVGGKQLVLQTAGAPGQGNPRRPAHPGVEVHRRPQYCHYPDDDRPGRPLFRVGPPGSGAPRGRRRPLPASGLFRLPDPADQFYRHLVDRVGFYFLSPGNQNHQLRPYVLGGDGVSVFRGHDAVSGREGGLDISWSVLIPTVAIVSLFFILVAGIVFRSHQLRPMTGAVGMVGERGVVYTPLNPDGQVFVHGEYWQAVSDEPIAKGEAVVVLEVMNLKLRVRRA